MTEYTVALSAIGRSSTGTPRSSADAAAVEHFGAEAIHDLSDIEGAGLCGFQRRFDLGDFLWGEMVDPFGLAAAHVCSGPGGGTLDQRPCHDVTFRRCEYCWRRRVPRCATELAFAVIAGPPQESKQVGHRVTQSAHGVSQRRQMALRAGCWHQPVHRGAKLADPMASTKSSR
jgi:hypothetical protein